jgi:hypothetical protein
VTKWRKRIPSRSSTDLKQNLKFRFCFFRFLLHSILKIIILLLVYKLISKLWTE